MGESIWRQWLDMAVSSFDAADTLDAAGEFSRESASRYYYAAYQAMTALLLYAGQVPPSVEGIVRESWNHEVTPLMVRENLRRIVPELAKRRDMGRRLSGLYKARIYADYVAYESLDAASLRSIRRDALYLLKIAQSALPRSL